MDSYHYINHHVLDYLCRKYCNPSPGDGSVPNLVIIAYDDNGQPYAKRAFNTQVCEQLNSWLGGFESILKCMTPGLFYHTTHVLAKKEQKKKSQKNNEDDEGEDLGLDEPESDSGSED